MPDQTVWAGFDDKGRFVVGFSFGNAAMFLQVKKRREHKRRREKQNRNSRHFYHGAGITRK